ncbi:MAG TPA: XRE family transcriptional regulator [Clostridiales bacterium]|nr:XRE family transcriptional regulator [Clostridiales bacterium]HCT85377.1 XRE family transcriptional regulator [Candidatus Margulisiibacteriota bacterium]
MKLIADNLIRIRNSNSISQQSLADKVGLSRTTIANIERDRFDPSIKNLQLLANALGVHIKEFFQ